MNEDIVHLMAWQKKLKDEYEESNMLPKINKSKMARTTEAMKVYVRSCQGVMRTPLAYIVRKTKIVETYGDYDKYKTTENEMIARVIHLPPDRKKLIPEKDAQTVQTYIAEYKIDNRTVYDILDQICKDTNLY